MNHETQRASILQMARGAFQERVDETCIGGCFGCPNTYGYEPKNKPCPHEHVHQREVKEVLCAACWDRIVPGSEGRNG